MDSGRTNDELERVRMKLLVPGKLASKLFRG